MDSWWNGARRMPSPRRGHQRPPALTPRPRGRNLCGVSAIDPDVAGQLAEELPRDVFVGIVRTFEQDLARLVRQMVDAARAGDVEEYRRAAHGLAGAAGSIGARSLEAMARQAMRPDDRTPAQRMIIGIGEEAKAALSELAALAAGDGPA